MLNTALRGCPVGRVIQLEGNKGLLGVEALQSRGIDLAVSTADALLNLEILTFGVLGVDLEFGIWILKFGI